MLRKLARLTFNVLAALSLVLCVGVCVLWVRSYYVWDGVVWWYGGEPADDGDLACVVTAAWSLRGRVWVEREAVPAADRYPEEPVLQWFRGEARYFDPPGGGDESRWLGLGYRALPEPPAGAAGYAVSAPHPTLAAAAAVAPLAWAARRWRGSRRQRATRRGLCPACGYDLRATPGRCPECGAGVKPAGGT